MDSNSIELYKMKFITRDTLWDLSSNYGSYNLRFKSNVDNLDKYLMKVKMLGYKVMNLPKSIDTVNVKLIVNEQDIVIVSDKQLAIAESGQANGLFMNLKFKSLSLKDVYTSHIFSMSGMFSNFKTSELDLSTLDTSNVTNMHIMFAQAKIPNIDISNFNFEKVRTMEKMFYSCNADTINVRNIKLPKDVKKDEIFDYCTAKIL